MLSNINADKDQLLQVILVGQPQLKQLLQRPELVQFAQRIASDFHLKPFNTEEAGDYINHRLKLAGASREIFTKAARDRIAKATGGIPRLINVICDTALIYAFSSGVETIDIDIIEEIIRDKAEHGIFSYDNPPRAEHEPEQRSVYWRQHKVISIE